MANNTQINSNNNAINSIVEETKEDRLSSLPDEILINSIVEETKEDRLSSLPDEILIKILSNLSIFSAVETTFFSRRWRNLWKSITTVELNASGMKFDKISALFSLLTSSNNKLEVLKLRSSLKSMSITCPSDYLPVPSCVLNCESLVVMELDGILDCRLELDEDNDVPINGASINLPNLKKLVLRVNGGDYCLLRTMLKFCPKLEDMSLLLKLTDEELDLDLIAPNLKSLNIDVVVPSSYSAIAIDAPELAKLKIRDPCSFYTFKTIPTSLVKVSINLKRIEGTDWFPGGAEFFEWSEEGHALAMSEFVRDMSSVSYLEVECYDNMHTFFGPQYNGDMPVLPDLTFLKINSIESSRGWEDLLCALHCFPNLEHLKLEIGDYYVSWPSDWFAPIVLPDCLLTKLKRVTIKRAGRVSHEVKLLEFILNHAHVLEKLCIYGPSSRLRLEFNVPHSELLWREYNFCQALFKLPRSSLTCEIVVSGYCINASSNAFENELMGCQIEFDNDDKLFDSDSDYSD